MHRMHRITVILGIVAFAFSLATSRASASLLKPEAGRAFPDIAANINGSVTYTYDAATETGLFEMRNTPYLMAAGSTQNLEYLVQPVLGEGVRFQELRLTLDKNGKLVANSGNFYELHGTVVADGQTYTGLLLKGTPSAFGSQDLGSVGIQGSDVFDVELDITGGALASFFGPESYMRITPELQSTFKGRFTENFSGVKTTTNTRSYSAPHPFPIPEPTTLALLVLGGGGLVVRARHWQRRGPRA